MASIIEIHYSHPSIKELNGVIKVDPDDTLETWVDGGDFDYPFNQFQPH